MAQNMLQSSLRSMRVLQRKVDGAVLGLVSTMYSLAVFLLKRLRTT
jgi:hypothetical protein